MVFDKLIKNLINTQDTTPPTPTPTASPLKSKPLVLPHPEEPMNSLATLANIDVNVIITRWLTDWGVPTTWWFHWRNAIDILVYDIYPSSVIAMGITQETPAVTWEANGKRHIAIKPKWLNPGVVAHEQAHTSYAYLNSDQKSAFSALHASLKNTDPLIKHLYSINTYGLTNDIEGHAEVYRYLGQQMPAQLKTYYPTLF